jgi:hypothetical protein
VKTYRDLEELSAFACNRCVRKRNIWIAAALMAVWLFMFILFAFGGEDIHGDIAPLWLLLILLLAFAASLAWLLYEVNCIRKGKEEKGNEASDGMVKKLLEKEHLAKAQPSDSVHAYFTPSNYRQLKKTNQFL